MEIESWSLRGGDLMRNKTGYYLCGAYCDKISFDIHTGWRPKIEFGENYAV
jgi:hypothetical protein